jgi:hypothetical protein
LGCIEAACESVLKDVGGRRRTGIESQGVRGAGEKAVDGIPEKKEKSCLRRCEPKKLGNPGVVEVVWGPLTSDGPGRAGKPQGIFVDVVLREVGEGEVRKELPLFVDVEEGSVIDGGVAGDEVEPPRGASTLCTDSDEVGRSGKFVRQSVRRGKAIVGGIVGRVEAEAMAKCSDSAIGKDGSI